MMTIVNNNLDDESQANSELTEPTTDLGETLNRVMSRIQQHISMRMNDAVAVTLWAAHTHVIDSFDIAPRLVLTSPMPGSGKSTVLRVLNRLCARARLTSNTTAAAVFRGVGASNPPTILIDEADSFKSDGELANILKQSHMRDAAVTERADKDDKEGYKTKRFFTFAPIAIATLRAPDNALRSRSLVISMQKPKRGDPPPARLQRADLDELDKLGEELGTVSVVR